MTKPIEPKIFMDDMIDETKYLVARYELKAKDQKKAIESLCLGQSVGNPEVRNEWETQELFDNYACIARQYGKYVDIGFPIINWESGGWNHLLCMLMGGHTDIDIIEGCELLDITLPKTNLNHFSRAPLYGMTGIRKRSRQHNKPLLGGILKPKVGLTPGQMFDMVKQMVDGGVDFIKEDEILASPGYCQLDYRAQKIAAYCDKYGVTYCFTFNIAPNYMNNEIDFISNLYYDNGKSYERASVGVHYNIFGGLDGYKAIRDQNEVFLHAQTSGKNLLTQGPHRISWHCLCKMLCLIGVDSIQVGMIGGYSNQEGSVENIINLCNSYNVVPALSCGFHPGLVEYVTSKVGHDYMANVGGAIHGHPGGTYKGTLAMRQAIDGNYGKEYWDAIEKWGKKE